MFKQIVTTMGAVLVTGSLAFAGQTAKAPEKAAGQKPAATATTESTKKAATHKRHRAHHKATKSMKKAAPVAPTSAPTAPAKK